MKRSPRIPALLALAVTLAAPAAYAEDDPVARHLFPPELVMAHQQEIGLSAAQRDAVKAAIGEAQSLFLDLQWEVQAQASALGKLLAQSPVDEEAALAEAERLMALEARVKRAQLALLIRIKNVLTPVQQERLQELRRAGQGG
jgi:Spy/CpxP family protein refolding chaperone